MNSSDYTSPTQQRIDPVILKRLQNRLTNNVISIKKKIPNPLRADPTRTSKLRRLFVSAMRKRWKLLKADITRKIVDEDALGLKPVPHLKTNAPPGGDFRFHSTSEKQKAFLAWLKKQMQYRIMGTTLEQIEKAWWKQYAEQGHRQGMGRAYDDLHKKVTGEKGMGDFYDGSRREFLRDSFTKPVSAERIKILASRTFTDLEGVTEATATVISRSLLDGLVRGDNPRTIAEDLNEDVDGIGIARAEMIARTEIIRAHAEGQLDGMEAMGVAAVGVMVEWSTAGDERVCPRCSEMEGETYEISEARNKIPMHPNCRCSFLPANVGELDKEIDDLLKKSDEDEEATENAFCPTGPGGGIDPSCGAGGGTRVVGDKTKAKIEQRKAKAKEDKAKLDAALGTLGRRQYKDLNNQRWYLARDIRRGVATENVKERMKDLAKQMKEMKEKVLNNPKGVAEKVQVPIRALPSKSPDHESPEEIMHRTSTIKESKELNPGAHVNKVYKVTLNNGVVGVWKPVEGEAQNMRMNIPNDGGYKREAAAYSVAKVIGMTDLVPITKERELNGKVGSFQEWVKATTAMAIPGSAKFDGDKDLARAAAYDVLIGNTDRHPGNWKVKNHHDKDNAKLTLIDNGLSLPTRSGNRANCYIFDQAVGNQRSWRGPLKASLKVPSEVKNWNWSKIEKALSSHKIEPVAIELAKKRFDRLQKAAFNGHGFDKVFY